MNKVFEKLYDEDLIKNKFKYDLETIEWNIKHSVISLRVLVRTQKLSPYICAKYVVFGGRNEQYADCTEDAWLCTGDILNRQKHITLEEMLEAHKIADAEDELEDELERELERIDKERIDEDEERIDEDEERIDEDEERI